MQCPAVSEVQALLKFTLQSEIDCRDQKEMMWSNEEIFKTERHYLCKISVWPSDLVACFLREENNQ